MLPLFSGQNVRVRLQPDSAEDAPQQHRIFTIRHLHSLPGNGAAQVALRHREEQQQLEILQ